MSHFTCMILGGNPEKQLEPYDENLETPETDQGEVSQEDINDMVEYYKDDKKITYPTFDELYENKGEDWNNNSWRKVGDKYHEFSTYNPKSKWDWYELGGRWTGFFKMKPKPSVAKVGKPGLMTKEAEPGFADECRKKDIDIEGMKDDAGKEAGDRYDEVMKVIGHLPKNKSWDTVRNEYPDNIDKARNVYGKQPRVKEFNKDHKFGFMASPDDYDMTREQYVENARNRAISTFAVIKDGVWYEKGEMGWWGMVLNETDQSEWDKRVMELIESVPDDTIITLYDCHI